MGQQVGQRSGLAVTFCLNSLVVQTLSEKVRRKRPLSRVSNSKRPDRFATGFLQMEAGFQSRMAERRGNGLRNAAENCHPTVIFDCFVEGSQHRQSPVIDLTDAPKIDHHLNRAIGDDIFHQFK